MCITIGQSNISKYPVTNITPYVFESPSLTFTHGSRILCAEESDGCQLLRAKAIL